jgi:hypothetical protein
VSPSETAVFSTFRQADTGLSHFVQLQRTGVTEELDPVTAMESAQVFPADRKTGLFLQEKMRPGNPRSTPPGMGLRCVRATRLVRQFSYQPFAMYRIFTEAHRRRFCRHRPAAAVEYNAGQEPAFQVLSDVAGQPTCARTRILSSCAAIYRTDASAGSRSRIMRQHVPLAAPRFSYADIRNREDRP